MIPGGMDPKKMQAMMRQMGIQSEDINANSVVIESIAGPKKASQIRRF